MQNVVDVACSSPPTSMNATKPAAQTVQAVDQDPFGLVLQKASDRIASQKQSDNASSSSISKSSSKNSGSDSTAHAKVSEAKNGREVVKTSKTDKPTNAEKTDKTEKPDDDKKSSKDEKAKDPSTMVNGYVSSTTSVENDTDVVNKSCLVDSVEAATEAVLPANLTQIAAASDQESNAQIKTDLTTDQTAVAATDTHSDDALNTKAAQPAVSFADTLAKAAKSGEETTTNLDPVADNANTKMTDAGKVSVSTSTNTNGEVTIDIARNYQEAAASASVSTEKAGKASEVENNQQTAPPDTPDGTTSVTASTVVQTTSQISEPARLAEAPKNEVITQVANQVDQMVKTNRSSVRLQLYPEELGHIDLRIVQTKDGIGVTMMADKASTHQALQSEMDSLKQRIEQAGIQLSNLNINQGQNSSRQQSFEHRQNFSNNSYPENGSELSNSPLVEKKVTLTSSVVDYRI